MVVGGGVDRMHRRGNGGVVRSRHFNCTIRMKNVEQLSWAAGRSPVSAGDAGGVVHLPVMLAQVTGDNHLKVGMTEVWAELFIQRGHK